MATSSEYIFRCVGGINLSKPYTRAMIDASGRVAPRFSATTQSSRDTLFHPHATRATVHVHGHSHPPARASLGWLQDMHRRRASLGRFVCVSSKGDDHAVPCSSIFPPGHATPGHARPRRSKTGCCVHVLKNNCLFACLSLVQERWTVLRYVLLNHSGASEASEGGLSWKVLRQGAVFMYIDSGRVIKVYGCILESFVCNRL